MLQITNFVELRVVLGRSRKRAGRPHTIPGRPMLIHTCYAMSCHVHAAPMPCWAVALRSHFQNSMFVAWPGRGMICVSQTQPHCVNQMRKTQSKPIVARQWQGNGMGTAWDVWISLNTYWSLLSGQDFESFEQRNLKSVHEKRSLPLVFLVPCIASGIVWVCAPHKEYYRMPFTSHKQKSYTVVN
jgi:hypothetical protein